MVQWPSESVRNLGQKKKKKKKIRAAQHDGGTRTQKASHVRVSTVFWLPSYSRRVQTYYLLFYFFTSCDCWIFESLILILSYAFDTFATMRHICVTLRFVSLARRHICVTLLIIHICVQVDYQLFIYQLLIIHIINWCWLFIYVFYMCTSKYVQHIT